MQGVPSSIMLDFVEQSILFVKLIMSLLELVKHAILVTKDRVKLVLLMKILLVLLKTAHKQMMMAFV